MALAPLLESYDNVLLDLDGCVWVGDSPTRGASEAIGALRGAGKRVGFITNNSRSAPEEYVRRLWSLGAQASLEEVVTAGSAIQWVLAQRERMGTYVIGSAALHRHVADAGQRILNGSATAQSAELVVVAGHDRFDFSELRIATRALLAGAELIAADRDRTFPAEDGLNPGSGAIVAALEYVSERQAQVIGKPQGEIFSTALERLGPGRTLVIGDRLDADLLGAAAAGLDGAIVLTGVSTPEQAHQADDPAPVAVGEDLHEVVTGR